MHALEGATRLGSLVALGYVCLWLLPSLANATDVTVLDPDTLSDDLGNTADAFSNITYVPLVDPNDYKSKRFKDVGSIKPFYDLAQSIIDSSLQGDYPIDLVKKFKDGDLDPASDAQSFITANIGYIIAVGVGLLFLLIFPIVGCCFCCCRCCGRCGGNRMMRTPEEAGYGASTGRLVKAILMFLFTLFLCTGGILMVITNNQMTDSLKSFSDNGLDQLNDVSNFLNSTIDQAEQLVGQRFNFTLQVLFRDLDNIGYLLGRDIQRNVITTSGIEDIYNGIDNMEQDAKVMKDLLDRLDIERQLTLQYSTTYKTFTENLNDTATQLSAKYNGLQTATPSRDNINAEFSLPRELVKILVLEGFLNQSISALTNESRQQLNDIPQRVNDDTVTIRTDMKSSVRKYTSDLTQITDKVKDVRDNVDGGFDVNNLKSSAQDFTDPAEEYDQYRWYGGLGLAVLVVLISCLYFLGVIVGMCGGDVFVQPTHRSGMSHSGGNLLTAGIILTFVFGWFLMLLTTLLFTVGAPIDKFVCQPVEDLSLLDEILIELDSSTSGRSWLGKMIYPNKNVDLSVDSLMTACKDNAAIYTALKMEGQLFNLSEITDYTKVFNVSQELSSINVDFNTVSILTSDMFSFLDFMIDFHDNMSYPTYETAMADNPIARSRTYLTEAKTFKNTLAAGQEKTEIEEMINNYEANITAYNGNLLEDSLNKMNQTLEELQNTTQIPSNNTVSDRATKLKQSLTLIQSAMGNYTKDSLNQAIQDYEARLVKILDTYIESVVHSLETELGQCRPIWNMYDGTLVRGICGTMLASVSGWWCAMGWSIFFAILCMCGAVPLSKHFFRMRHAKNKVADSSTEFEKSARASPVHHFQNKVYHSDAPISTQKF